MFFVSAPLNDLLQQAGISPDKLNRAFDIRIREGKKGMDRYDHFPRLLSRNGSVQISYLKRRNRYILMEAEFKASRYLEERRDNCWLICPGSIPSQAWSATSGRPLGHVVSIGPGYRSFESLIIRQPFDAWAGAIGFNLKPVWHRYG